MAESIFNKDAEKVVLARLLVNPAIRPELRIDANDFSPEVNRVVMSALDSCIASGIEVNIHSVTDRLNSLGVKLGGVLEPGIYLNSLTLLNVDDSTAVERAREMKRWTVRRELHKIGEDIIALTKDDKPGKDGKIKRAGELVAEVTERFNRHVNIIEGSQEHEPVDLYGTIDQFMERDFSVSNRAIVPPWERFADLYGFWDGGTAPHLFVARMKIGKSSLWGSGLLDLALQDHDDTLRALALDTELTDWENHSRVLAAVSQVPEFYIRQGWYLKRPDMRKRVEDAAKIVKPLKSRLHHCGVNGMGMDEIVSIARRWAHKHVRGNKRGLIIYDYIKLLSQSDFDAKSFHVTFAKKMEIIKNLGRELGIPIITFAQSNRENVESKAGDRQRGTGVVGGSDMLLQFCSNGYLLEELTPDERLEMNQLGAEDATHSLRELACRQQGPRELGIGGMVKYKDEKGKDKLCKDFLLYNFSSFRVKEVCSFRDVVQRAQSVGAKIQPPDAKPRGEML
jgi:replicative DNA helicase